MHRISIALVLLIPFTATGGSDAVALYSSYWRLLSCGKFVEAANFIHPQDLAELKSGLVPVFSSAMSNTNAREVAAKFFAASTSPDPKAIDERQVFAGVAAVGGLAESVGRLCGTEIVDAKVKVASSGQVQVSYSIRVADKTIAADDPETFDNYQGRLFLRLSTRPAETIQLVKKAFGQRD